LLHARALCDHGAPRRSPQKPRVVDRGHISTGKYSRCAGRAIRGPDLRNANNGAPPHYRTLYLELRRRPAVSMSRGHAQPQPSATSRRYGGGAEEPAPMPAGVTGHRSQRPRAGQVGPPGPHPAQPSSSLDPGGERRPIPPPLAPLIAQLVSTTSY
jgi:hypothetical protein